MPWRRRGSQYPLRAGEAENATAEEISAELIDRGFEVEWSPDGIGGLNKARSLRLDAMIVDRLLPRVDGHRVRGLRMGSDDYLTKLFAVVEIRRPN